MEIQRLVVEEPQHAFTLDFHAGLTVAFHENPALRSRCLSDLIEALGPGRAGYHVEVLDNEHRHLVVFRPAGRPHQVIDVEAAADVSEEFRGPDGRIDLLGWMGLAPQASQRLLRVGARQLDRGFDTGTDDHRLARRLAAIDPARLWGAADTLERTAEELRQARRDLPVDDLDELTSFEQIADLHELTEEQLGAHRPVQRVGPLLASGCVLVGLLLSLLRTHIGDNQFTSDALLVLGALAAAVTVGDLFLIRRIRRRERAALAGRGASSFARLVEQVGPVADAERRRALLAAHAAHEQAVLDWQELTDDASPDWALRYREQVQAIAVRKRELRRLGATQLAAEESSTADAARVLVDKVIELRGVGPRQERLPLLLDEPFAGMAPVEVEQLLATVYRLASYHQVVLVTGDPFIQAWATEGPMARNIEFVRLGRTGTDAARSQAEPEGAGRAAGPPPGVDAPTPFRGSSASVPSRTAGDVGAVGTVNRTS